MTEIEFKAKITSSKIIEWVNKSKDIHALQRIRAKTNKRLKSIQSKEHNPLDNVDIEKKREILNELFV